jgi:hypothetical protein
LDLVPAPFIYLLFSEAQVVSQLLLKLLCPLTSAGLICALESLQLVPIFPEPLHAFETALESCLALFFGFFLALLWSLLDSRCLLFAYFFKNFIDFFRAIFLLFLDDGHMREAFFSNHFKAIRVAVLLIEIRSRC